MMAAERRVRQSGKDDDGDIISLCNRGKHWSPLAKNDAIRHIEGGIYEYFVDEAGHKTYVQVYTGADGEKHLRTTSDSTSENNLDNLPDC